MEIQQKITASITNQDALASTRAAKEQNVVVKTNGNVVPEAKLPTSVQIKAEVPETALENAAKAFNTLVDEISNRSISFTKDEGSGRTIIQVVDKETGDIVRQVPPQEYLDMVQKLNKAAEILLQDLPRVI